MNSPKGFYVLPFALDGLDVGMGFWDADKLSKKWLSVSERFLDFNGDVFDASWPGNLHSLRTKFTSANGAGLATFYVGEVLTSSMLLLSNSSPTTDGEVTALYIDSLQRSLRLAHAGEPSSGNEFETIRSVIQRPLLAVIEWPDSKVDPELRNAARELGVHFAWAFLSRLK